MTSEKVTFCFRCSYNGEINYRRKKETENGRTNVTNVTKGAFVIKLITQFRCRQKQTSGRSLGKSLKPEHTIKLVYVVSNTHNTMTHFSVDNKT
jgi:hypothetical protein